MWQKEKKDSSIVNLTLLLALTTIPAAATLATRHTVFAQSATHVPSPAKSLNVPSTTSIIRIDGSAGMAAINQALKQSFEKQFSGVKVDFATNGTDAALQALRKGKIDIAAISRDLTPEEEAEGLQQVHIHREKIAIVVGKNNTFKGSLNSKRFAKIFRGEITDWSQVGGSDGKIRFIDRPTTSELREAFRYYPVFKTAKFATGSTVTPLSEDSTPEIVKQLGKDGISYVLANQVSKLQGVRVLQMNHVAPDDPRYPFSLASVYVYKKNPNPNVNNFLGFSLASTGQHVVEQVVAAEATDLASGKSEPVATATNTSSATSQSVDETNISKATASPNAQQTNLAQPAHSSNNQSLVTFSQKITEEKLTPFLWWLLPLLTLGGLLLWWLRGRRSSENKTENLLQLAASIPLKEVSATHISSAVGRGDQQKPRGSVEKELQTTAVSHKMTDLSPLGDPVAVDNSSPLWQKFFNGGSNTKDLRSSEVLADEHPQESEITASYSNQQYVPQTLLDLEAPVTVVNSKYPELPDIPIITSHVKSEAKQPETRDLQPQVTEIQASLDNHDVVLNRIADEAESTDKMETEEISQKPQRTTKVASTSVFVRDDAPAEIKTAQASSLLDKPKTQSLDTKSQSHIVLEPRTPKWAYAFWQLCDYQKQKLRQQGGYQLLLRLYDVSDIDLSYQSPKLIQQYECEETIHDRYVAIPNSDRDYIAEIGYLTTDKRWLLLARSGIVRVFDRPDKDFWFVADAELIIHGAAEPGSKVAIDGHFIKVKPDGTFHLRIPFTDKLINYTMTAVAPDGEHPKTFEMNFSQENSQKGG